MPTTITIRDESMTGKMLGQWALEVLTERITVREVIRSRVYQLSSAGSRLSSYY